jgi:hypothetical protein
MKKVFKKKAKLSLSPKLMEKSLKKGETQFITIIDGKKFLKKKAKLSLSP